MKMNIKVANKPKVADMATVKLNLFYNNLVESHNEGELLFQLLIKNNIQPAKAEATWIKPAKIDYSNIKSLIEKYWIPSDRVRNINSIRLKHVPNFEFNRNSAPKYTATLFRLIVPDEYVRLSMIYSCPISSNNQQLILDYVNDMIGYSQVIYGSMQYLMDHEVNLHERRSVYSSNLDKSVYEGDAIFYFATDSLKQYIPDLYNVSIWGKPYIDMIGREKLLGMPCYKAEELAPDIIWTQLSPHVFDERGSWEALREAREAGKRHLDDNMFFNHRLPEDHVYRVPEFDFSEINRAMQLPEERKE